MKIFSSSPVLLIIRGLSSRLAIISLVVTCSLLSILLLLPYGIQYKLEKWLVSHDANYGQVENVDFNPFTGILLIKNLESGSDNTPHLVIPEARLSISWLPIFKGRIYINDIIIKNSRLNIRNHPDGRLQIGTLTTTPSNQPGTSKRIGFGIKKITLLNSKINYQSSVLQFNASISHASTGQLASWEPGQVTPIELSSTIGGGTLTFSGNIKPFTETPTIAGKLNLSNISLENFNTILLDKNLQVKGRIYANTRISIVRHQAKLKTQLAQIEHTLIGNVMLRNFDINDTTNKDSFLQLKKIAFENMQLKGTQILEVDKVNINSAKVNLHRNAQGEWPGFQNIMKGAAQPDESSKHTTLSLKIGQLTIDGESTINIQDQSVTPAFHSKLDISNASAFSIDSSHPEQAVILELAGKIDSYSNLKLTGQLKPFSQQTNMDIKGKVTNLDLPPFTAYTKKEMGYILKSGHMDLDLQARISNDIIKGDANIKLNNLKISPDDPEKMDALTKQLPVSLETTLALLRDKNNNIQMHVPITGNINDPNFDFSDNINQALGKAAKTSSVEYLKYAMGPYGTLISLAELVGKITGKINLEAIKFKAGKATLDSVSLDYLQHVAELLTKRPELNIKICGTAIASEDEELNDDELLSLAKTRASVIKEHLIKQYEVRPERLFLCNPEILTDTDAIPHAKLEL